MNSHHAATVKGLSDERKALVAMNFLNVLGLIPGLRISGNDDDYILSPERLGLVSPSRVEGDQETGIFARSAARH
jgi:hypothetical protein